MQEHNSRQLYFFPISFTPRFHSDSECCFSIKVESYRRDIYRPITGKDRLFGQTSLGPPLHLKFKIPSGFLVASDVDSCRIHISFVMADVEPRIREILVMYGIQLIGESQGRAFELKADAEDVEYHVMEESKGWTTCIPKSNTSPVNECIICLEELCDDEESIETHNCCHVFHKLCLWRWIRTKSSCPLCRHRIYSRPKLF